jgi:phosphoadenosine phosphosulfate reductase
MTPDLDRINRDFGNSPEALVRWACELDDKAIVTSNFGPFSAVVLHLVTRQRPDMPVIWMDSGYNTPETYRYADALAQRLRLNLHIYHPRRSRAHREAAEGAPPAVDDPRHAAFTEEVKLEPFDRAVADFKPRIWLNGIRRDQTQHRATLQPVSLSPEGVIKVAPVFHWSSRQMYEYLKAHDLPDNLDYYDVTKGDAHRECGLHLPH